LPSHIL
jgi:rubrerythrin